MPDNVVTLSQDEIRGKSIPALIDRAAQALASARSSGEVLEAREFARAAYDAARLAGRIGRAKAAHDQVIAAVYRAQADAAVIEALAKVRLADEYDAAQDRGEVARQGNSNLGASKVCTVSDIGLRSDEIHEARKLRDAEAEAPGAIKAAADAVVARGDEPTKSAIKREVIGRAHKTSGGPGADNSGISDGVPPGGPEQADKHAELRRELSKLTTDALIDDIIGLRLDLDDESAKRRKAERERDVYKSQLDDMIAADSSAAVIRKQAQEIRRLEAKAWKAEEDRTAILRQNFGLKKRLRQIEGEEIPL